jgi:hypothetical protein
VRTREHPEYRVVRDLYMPTTKRVRMFGIFPTQKPMMIARKKIAIGLILLVNGCIIHMDLDDHEHVSCIQTSDCPKLVRECVTNVCITNVCTAIDLSTLDDNATGKWCRPRIGIGDGGIDIDAGSPPPEPVPECQTDCDCFDDNACTQDTCVNGQCQNDAIEGGCGDTIGSCRGTWCCTSEYTCFQAYDNSSECEVTP